MAMSKRQIQEFQEKKRAIEEKTLESTVESLRLLQETQKCGIETANELNRQGEQLKSIDKQLDDINTILIESQKNIKCMTSMFNGFKHLFRKKKNEATFCVNESDIKAIQTSSQCQNKTSINNDLQDPNACSIPSSRTQQQLTSGSDFESKFNANMNEICKNISGLKSLAVDVGKELDNQNKLIGVISKKTEKADCSIEHQNIQIRKILGK